MDRPSLGNGLDSSNISSGTGMHLNQFGPEWIDIGT